MDLATTTMPNPENKHTKPSVIMFAMIVAGLAMLGYQMYTMIDLMNKMTLTHSPCANTTKAITETPTTCYHIKMLKIC